VITATAVLTLAGQFYERLVTTLQGSGQLRAVAVATSAPFAPGVRATFQPPDRGQVSAAGSGNEVAAEHIVSGDYFRVLGVPLLAGRSMRDGMIWAAGGILLGLIAAFAGARLIATLLFDVPAHDPVTYATVGGAVALVAMMACSIPAARAIRIDPTIAMRTE
jgi:hypothetical protein